MLHTLLSKPSDTALHFKGQTASSFPQNSHFSSTRRASNDMHLITRQTSFCRVREILGSFMRIARSILHKWPCFFSFFFLNKLEDTWEFPLRNRDTGALFYLLPHFSFLLVPLLVISSRELLPISPLLPQITPPGLEEQPSLAMDKSFTTQSTSGPSTCQTEITTALCSLYLFALLNIVLAEHFCSLCIK